MRPLIIDTNGLLRFLLNDIPEQADLIEKAIRKAEKDRRVVLIPQIVIFEISFILKSFYKLEKQAIIDKIHSILSVDILNIESKNLFLETLTLYGKNNVGFVDCFLLIKAEADGAELFTFDEKLKKLV